MRRGLALLVAALLFMTCVPALAALEETPPIALDCAGAILLEPESGQVIFEKNADERRPVASVTKIMAILLACEAVEQGRCALEDTVIVSERASSMGGSQVLLDTGETQPFSALLKSMIVASANDATVAVGEHLYGGEAAFVRQMNRRAAELGMTNTRFVNSTGLPAPDHYTTARDVGLMASALAAHDLYYDYSTIWMDRLDHGDGRVTDLTNTNRLTRLYEGCDGIKTGSTNEAGYCMAASALRGDMRLIAVVLGAKTGKERFSLASQMMDYGFANYRLYRAAGEGDRLKTRVPVTGGASDFVDAVLGGDMRFLISKGSEQNVQLEQELPDTLAAPIRAGQEIGGVNVLLEGRTIGRVPVVAATNVARQSYFDALNRLIGRFYRR